MWLLHCLFIHSLADGHMGQLWVLAVANKAALIILAHAFWDLHLLICVGDRTYNFKFHKINRDQQPENIIFTLRVTTYECLSHTLRLSLGTQHWHLTLDRYFLSLD